MLPTLHAMQTDGKADQKGGFCEKHRFFFATSWPLPDS